MSSVSGCDKQFEARQLLSQTTATPVKRRTTHEHEEGRIEAPPPTPTPVATPTPTPTDTVSVISAVYTNGNHTLRVQATDSIKSYVRGAPVLHVHVTSTDALIGDLSSSSDGTYVGDLPYPENPELITVRSSLGGHADMAVVVGRDPR